MQCEGKKTDKELIRVTFSKFPANKYVCPNKISNESVAVSVSLELIHDLSKSIVCELLRSS